MLSFFPKYRISGATIETLKRNEPDRWAAAEADLPVGILPNSRGKAIQITGDQRDRLVALAVLVELGVYKRTFPGARSEPVEALVGEPIEDAVDRVERIQREADAEAFGG